MLKTLLLPLVLFAGPSLFGQPRFSIGINIGTPYAYAPPPPVYVAYRPPCPGPDYVWVDGYWYPNGPRYAWRAGYWAAPPYAGAYWVAPHYHGRTYYSGHWKGGGPKAHGRHDNGRRGWRR